MIRDVVGTGGIIITQKNEARIVRVQMSLNVKFIHCKYYSYSYYLCLL